jgi:hypothetical protein
MPAVKASKEQGRVHGAGEVKQPHLIGLTRRVFGQEWLPTLTVQINSKVS